MFGPIGTTELIIILVLALIIFGPGKLPDVGRAVGRSIKEFKRASSSLEDDVNETGGRAATSGGDQPSAVESKQPPSESTQSGTESKHS